MRKQRMRDRVTGRENGRNNSCFSENRNDFQSLSDLTKHWTFKFTGKIDPRWKEGFARLQHRSLKS